MSGDHFSSRTKDIIRKRASFICSNPDCRALTLCPSNADESKTINIGIAAHITAASKGGPRFDPSISSEQRSSIDNGIFLCSSCASMVDANHGVDFSVELLRSWRENHHQWVSSNLNKQVSLISEDFSFPNLELVFQDGSNKVSLAREDPNSNDENSWKSDLAQSVVCIELALHNSGEISATDIDGWIDIPQGTSLFDKVAMEQYWKIFPLNPFEDSEEFANIVFGADRRTALERVTDSLSDALLFGIFESYVTVQLGSKLLDPLTKTLKPTLTGDQITFSLQKLKHGSTFFFDRVFLILHKNVVGETIELNFRVNAEELPSDISGSLVIVG